MCTDPVEEIDRENVDAPRIEMTVIIVAAAEMESIDADEMTLVNVNASVRMILKSLDERSVGIVARAGGLDLELTRYVLRESE